MSTKENTRQAAKKPLSAATVSDLRTESLAV
jgi:hypothetical protein